MISLGSLLIACCKLAPTLASKMWRHNYVIDRNECLIFTFSESINPWVYSVQFLFKSTNNSWRYERKCEWVFFSEHSVDLKLDSWCIYHYWSYIHHVELPEDWILDTLYSRDMCPRLCHRPIKQRCNPVVFVSFNELNQTVFLHQQPNNNSSLLSRQQPITTVLSCKEGGYWLGQSAKFSVINHVIFCLPIFTELGYLGYTPIKLGVGWGGRALTHHPAKFRGFRSSQCLMH